MFLSKADEGNLGHTKNTGGVFGRDSSGQQLSRGVSIASLA